MGRVRIVDPDTERPPETAGLPVFDRVVWAGDVAGQGAPGEGPSGARTLAERVSAGSASGDGPTGEHAPGGGASCARAAGHGAFVGVLRLPFEMRARSRLRARLVEGGEVALVLPRGTVLRGGALVAGAHGCLRIEAADEDIVTVRAAHPIALARAAYHLGNRHVPVQVLHDALMFGYDAVLVDMLVRMGVRTQRAWAPFEPEAGAYGSADAHGHSAGHGH